MAGCIRGLNEPSRASDRFSAQTPLTQGVGLTPYAASQFTTFELPAYGEQAIVGSNIFALAYNAKSVTDTRSELGLRTDKSFAIPDGVFTLRGRAACVHMTLIRT